MRALLSPLVFLSLLLSAPLVAQDPDAGRTEAASSESPKAQMKRINAALKVVSEFLEDPKGDAPLGEVANVQALVLEAKRLIPSTTEKQPEAKREDYLKGYRAQLNGLLRVVLDLEDALEEGDWKAASKAMAEVDKAKREGHGKYKPRGRGGRGRAGQNGGR